MGATHQRACLKLTASGRGTANQKIHAYGVFLVVALSFICLIVYNFSDQVLLIWERKAAKSWEAAARHAKETAQARERWKNAKDGLKKQKKEWGLGRTLSTHNTCTFSLDKSARNAEPSNVSLDKLHYRRESSSGISSLAHFLSKDTPDHLNTVIKPLVYLSTFYFFSNPRSPFQDNYAVLLCLVYCATGIGYTLAIYLDPSPAQLTSVLLPVVMTLIATQAKDSAVAGAVARFTYTKRAVEAFVIGNAERYSGVWLISRCTVKKE